jgi:glycosyltransferase involved in cell wall biosynthesis
VPRARILAGFYFYPRGGSAHAARAIARELAGREVELTLVAGTRSDVGVDADATRFFAGIPLHPVDFTEALGEEDPVRFAGGAGTAPMHGSYEDRRGAEDPVFATLDADDLELHVEAWTRELRAAGAERADLFYLHHLSPLNEAVARAWPGTPVVGHVHGSELLMLEAIAAGAPPSWICAREWGERLRRWARRCERLVVNSPKGRERAAALLGVEPERFLLIPNGFEQELFVPRELDRRRFWLEALCERPRGQRPGEPPGSASYSPEQLAPLLAGPVLLYSGRFTAVKRLPLLIECFAAARERLGGRGALVLLGGYPGEWEGEHPVQAAERLGCETVYLAGWHSHEELPDFLNASDALVHASAEEQFGQVLIEAMACALPVVAIDRGGPASIVEDGRTGWLVEPDDRDGLAAAIAAAAGDPEERRRRGLAAREAALADYTWAAIGARLEAELMRLAQPPAS